jgi:hypothetical protein
MYDDMLPTMTRLRRPLGNGVKAFKVDVLVQW